MWCQVPNQQAFPNLQEHAGLDFRPRSKKGMAYIRRAALYADSCSDLHTEPLVTLP